jgi:hypothetical protein
MFPYTRFYLVAVYVFPLTGHNRIERLDDELFSSSLGKTIKVFCCSENNIQELPSSLCFVDPHGDLEAEFLPLISPPQYLVTEGIAALQPYMKIRRQRREEIEQMLLDQDFDFVLERSYPVACDGKSICCMYRMVSVIFIILSYTYIGIPTV